MSATKFEMGWAWPAHERHMLDWLRGMDNKHRLNGRATYQGRKQNTFLDLCRKAGPMDVVCDVGAHVGLWGFNFAHAFKHVEAFEPVAVHRECFALNVTLPNITMHPIALGAEPEWVSMWTEEGSSGNTQVRGAGDIEMRTLDSFEFPVCSGLKIDAEGFELNILRGAEQTIRRCKPVIVVEQKGEMSLRFGLETKGAVKFVESLGYRLADSYSGDYFLVPA